MMKKINNQSTDVVLKRRNKYFKNKTWMVYHAGFSL